MSVAEKKSFSAKIQQIFDNYGFGEGNFLDEVLAVVGEAEGQIADLQKKLEAIQQHIEKFPDSDFMTMAGLKAKSTTYRGREVQTWLKELEGLAKQ